MFSFRGPNLGQTRPPFSHFLHDFYKIVKMRKPGKSRKSAISSIFPARAQRTLDPRRALRTPFSGPLGAKAPKNLKMFEKKKSQNSRFRDFGTSRPPSPRAPLTGTKNRSLSELKFRKARFLVKISEIKIFLRKSQKSTFSKFSTRGRAQRPITLPAKNPY